MRWRGRDRPKGPVHLRRSFVTPEGVDLQLELGGAGARAIAFTLDALIMITIMVVITIAVALLLTAGIQSQLLEILWLVGFFLLRNFWFVLFEMGGRGATPGKRIMGLRVVARDGARLTGSAVIARNAMREIEIFLPLSFLGYEASQNAVDGWVALFSLAWSGIFLFFPLTNRDRLRVGDLVAGTWVVQNVEAPLGLDIAGVRRDAPRRAFSEATLDLYGTYELQTLEDVLRRGDADAMTLVAAAIRRKAGLADEGDDAGFLHDYYAALCARLERRMMVGLRRADKHELWTAR